MKVYYINPSILDDIDEMVIAATRPINFILLTEKEWADVMAFGKECGFRDQGLRYMTSSHIEYRGTTLIKEKE